MESSAPPPSSEITSPPSKPPGGKRKKIFIITVIILLLVAISTIFAFLFIATKAPTATTPSVPTSSVQEDDFARQYLKGCQKDKKVTFTHFPVALSQLGHLEPMGKVSDGHVTPTDHAYLAPLDQAAADNTTDVVMPADGVVTSIQAMPAQYIGDKNQQVAAEDHRLVITHNCQYVSIFIHVHQLSDTLKAAAGTLQPNTQKEASIPLKAGDTLGKIGGNPVDWSLMDATKKLSGLITPNLYKSEPWKIHVIDPVSVYTGELQAQLIAKSLRTTAPYGGKIDYDKKGALIGNWFREGTNGYTGTNQERYWDGHLSIAPNYIDPSATTVSLGNWQGKAAQFTASSGAPNPETVTGASGPVKYELIEQSYTSPSGVQLDGQLVKGAQVVQTGSIKGVILVEVLEGEKVKVELFPGKTAAQVAGFTSAATTYYR